MQQLSELKELNLAMNLIVALPKTFSFDSLLLLDISYNKLTTIDINFEGIPLLKELHCSDNSLTSLPGSLGTCKHLVLIEATNNQITEIPFELSTCTSLVKLDFTMNKISLIPADLASCEHLQRVDLSKNPVHEKLLPACVDHREVEFIKTDEYAAVYWTASGRQRPANVV